MNNINHWKKDIKKNIKFINLNRASHIIMFFLLLSTIHVLTSISPLYKSYMLKESDIVLNKENKTISIHKIEEKEARELETINFDKEIISDETFDQMYSDYNKAPRSIFKNYIVSKNYKNLIEGLKITFILYIIITIIAEILKKEDPFTEYILKKINILQIYFLVFGVLGVLFGWYDYISKRNNLSNFIGNNDYYLIIFACVLVVKIVIEKGIVLKKGRIKIGTMKILSSISKINIFKRAIALFFNLNLLLNLLKKNTMKICFIFFTNIINIEKVFYLSF